MTRPRTVADGDRTVHLHPRRQEPTSSPTRPEALEGRFDAFEPSRRKWLVRAALQMGLSPAEGMEKVKERLARSCERVARHGQTPSYPPDEEWEKDLHALLGVPWPCAEAAEFPEMWSAVLDTMEARGLRVGRQAYDSEHALGAPAGMAGTGSGRRRRVGRSRR